MTQRKALAAALLLAMACCIPASRADEALGRLFFSPERRKDLDRLRQMKQLGNEAPEVSPALTINGLLTRSNGQRTSWVNGVARNENEASASIVVVAHKNDPGRVVLSGTDLPATNARVGETLRRGGLTVQGLLNGGRIAINPPAEK